MAGDTMPTAGAERMFGDVREFCVQVGEQRLAGNEHHCPVRGFAGNDVALADIGDVFLDRVGEFLSRLACLRRIPFGQKLAMARHRELGVDGNRARRVREHDQAIHPRAIGECLLKRKRG